MKINYDVMQENDSHERKIIDIIHKESIFCTFNNKSIRFYNSFPLYPGYESFENVREEIVDNLVFNRILNPVVLNALCSDFYEKTSSNIKKLNLNS